MKPILKSPEALALLVSLCTLSACDPTGSNPPEGPPKSKPTTSTGVGSPSDCNNTEVGTRLLRRLTRLELANTLTDVFPTESASATQILPGDLVEGIRLSNDVSTLLMGTQMVQALLARAEQIAGTASAKAALDLTFPCAAAGDVACVTTIVDDFGQRLFRRPLNEVERGRYLALHAQVSGQSDFYMGVKWTLVALMQSPHAVYRTELGDGEGLTPYEIASELSYNYAASPPSDELIALGLSGGLDNPETRISEAKKLLDTPRGREVVRQFFGEWLTYEQAGAAPRANGPENFDLIRSKMVQETSAFLNKALFEKNGDLTELLTANYTVADEDLAAYYGLSVGTGDILAGGGVEAPRTHGVGVFAQGSVLTTMASVQITSPTRRGLLLLKRLYCEVPGVPEAVNFDLTSDTLTGNTTRERLENSHLASPSCQSCHASFDPLGFAFEKFDHIGRHREEETNPQGTFPIDDSTVVEKLEDRLVTGQEELMIGLAQDDEVTSCVSGTLERYVYGGEGECRAPDSRLALMKGEISVVEFLARLAGEPHFTRRD